MEAYFDYDKVTGLSNALGGRVDLLEKVLGLKARENLKYSDIQKIVKSGYAEEFFDLGDEIMTEYTATDGTVYDFPWRVVDFRDVTWEDGTEHPGMVLQSKYATVEKISFDAAEKNIVNAESEQTAKEGWYYWGKTGNKYTFLNLSTGDTIPFNDYTNVFKNTINNIDILLNGYSNYKVSAIRQWLNSGAGVNEWWSPAHLGDVAPAEASTLNGFISEISSDFIDILKPIKVCTLTTRGIDVVYDKMFLPSAEEMYGETRYHGYEGPYFQYWKEKTELSSPSASDNSGRIIPFIVDTDRRYCWLRTRQLDHLGKLLVCDAGNITNGSPGYALHASPCCVIS